MKRKVTGPVSVKTVDDMIATVNDFKQWQRQKSELLLQRLSELGMTDASLRFARAVYTGQKDVNITAERISNGYVIRANGESVLFIEFGSGVTYGYGHPEAAEHGMGPGTYPGKGHWDDPKGWRLPRSKGGEHTFGNPPAMAMYETVKDLQRILPQLIREVFQ